MPILILNLIFAATLSYAAPVPSTIVNYVGGFIECARLLTTGQANRLLTQELLDAGLTNEDDTFGYIGLTRAQGQELFKTGQVELVTVGASGNEGMGAEVVLPRDWHRHEAIHLAQEFVIYQNVFHTLMRRLERRPGLKQRLYEALPEIVESLSGSLTYNENTGRFLVLLKDIHAILEGLPLTKRELEDDDLLRRIFSDFPAREGFIVGIRRMSHKRVDRNEATILLNTGLHLTDLTGVASLTEADHEFLKAHGAL